MNAICKEGLWKNASRDKISFTPREKKLGSEPSLG